jgi:hypothetical protein
MLYLIKMDDDFYLKKDLTKKKKNEIIDMFIKCQDLLGEANKCKENLAKEIIEMKSQFGDFSFKKLRKVRRPYGGIQ